MTSDTDRLDAIARPHATVADKIRALSAAGVARADIARFLGKRYQHVRNVLEGDAQSGGGYVLGKADLSGVAETSAAYRPDPDDPAVIEPRGNGAYWLRVNPDGSLPLPKELADTLEAMPGLRVLARLKGDEVTIVSAETSMRRVRELVRRRVPRGVSLVDELIADRRAEAEREANDD